MLISGLKGLKSCTKTIEYGEIYVNLMVKQLPKHSPNFSDNVCESKQLHCKSITTLLRWEIISFQVTSLPSPQYLAAVSKTISWYP